MKYKSIVISGLPGSGKGVLAKKLVEKYNWEVFSAGDLWREKHKEEYPNQEISFEGFWKNQTKESQKEMDCLIRTKLEKGEIIGEFRWTKICEGLPALFVFLNPSLDIRAKRAQEINKYNAKDLETIRQILQGREQDEVRIGKQLHGQDYDYRDPKNYDLILDPGKLTLDEEVEIIDNLLNSNL